MIAILWILWATGGVGGRGTRMARTSACAGLAVSLFMVTTAADTVPPVPDAVDEENILDLDIQQATNAEASSPHDQDQRDETESFNGKNEEKPPVLVDDTRSSQGQPPPVGQDTIDNHEEEEMVEEKEQTPKPLLDSRTMEDGDRVSEDVKESTEPEQEQRETFKEEGTETAPATFVQPDQETDSSGILTVNGGDPDETETPDMLSESLEKDQVPSPTATDDVEREPTTEQGWDIPTVDHKDHLDEDHETKEAMVAASEQINDDEAVENNQEDVAETSNSTNHYWNESTKDGENEDDEGLEETSDAATRPTSTTILTTYQETDEPSANVVVESAPPTSSTKPQDENEKGDDEEAQDKDNENGQHAQEHDTPPVWNETATMSSTATNNTRTLSLDPPSPNETDPASITRAATENTTKYEDPDALSNTTGDNGPSCYYCGTIWGKSRTNPPGTNWTSLRLLWEEESCPQPTPPLRQNQKDTSDGRNVDSTMDDLKNQETNPSGKPNTSEEQLHSKPMNKEVEETGKGSDSTVDQGARPSYSSANSDFVEGLDDIHKFFEDVDPPDELDIGAGGSSIQEVLMGQGSQIVRKRILLALQHARTVLVQYFQRLSQTLVVQVRHLREEWDWETVHEWITTRIQDVAQVSYQTIRRILNGDFFMDDLDDDHLFGDDDPDNEGYATLNYQQEQQQQQQQQPFTDPDEAIRRLVDRSLG